MTDKIDYDLIGKHLLKITPLLTLIKDNIPKDKEPLLKHLAAASIHLAFFAENIFNYKEDKESEINKELIDKFLKECGCGFNKN